MPGADIARLPSDRRHELVRVAAGEFASSGYAGASLNRIIRRCGMSKSSFYYVIASKSALFDLVIRDLAADVAAAMDVPPPEQFAGARFWPRATEFLNQLIDLSRSNEAVMLLGRVFYAEAPEDAQVGVTGVLAAVRAWLDNVLAVGRSAGAVRDDLPTELQGDLLFGILRIFDEWTLRNYSAGYPPDVQRLLDAQFATIKRMLEPSREGML